MSQEKCKNCQTNLLENAQFCHHCGAKVIRQRITLKNLWQNLFMSIFGWDNKYLFTFKELLLRPHIVFQEYIQGTRKKYLNPFTFFTIGAAIAILIFNTFSEEYLKISTQVNNNQYELMKGRLAPKDTLSATVKENTEKNDKMKKKQAEWNLKTQKLILQYFNIFSFIILPFYSFIAYLVYWKPYNFGEHLIINAYIQGISFISMSIIFLLSLITIPNVFFAGMLVLIGIYLYVYSKLYQLSFIKIILKLLKFLGILLAMAITLFLIGIVIGVVLALLGVSK